MEWADPPIHFLPDWEFATSETITRMLWRLASAEADAVSQGAAGIGSMLSTRLDGDQPEVPDVDAPGPFDQSDMPEPRALYKSFGPDVSNGIDCQNWEAL
jgi:hypothetical protein